MTAQTTFFNTWYLLPHTWLVLFAILLPLVALLAKNRRGVREAWTAIGFALALFTTYQLWNSVEAEGALEVFFTEFASRRYPFIYIDQLSIFFAAIFCTLGLFATIFSYRYMEHDTGRTEYYALLLLMVSGMVGVALAGDLLSFIIFWEVMALTSYALVAFRKTLWEPVEAGFKYMIMSGSGTAALALAIVLIYGFTGTLSIPDLASSTLCPGWHGSVLQPWHILALVLFIVGLGIKAAIVPLHSWLPDAHPAAPTPISAMLSGVVIKTGVYGFFRILFTLYPPSPVFSFVDWRLPLALIAVATMTVGNLMALVQTDIKRLLAYSSIAQIGYIMFGISIPPPGTALALAGSALHVLNHALMKGLLFLAAGAFIHEVGTRDLRQLAGVGRRMPAAGLSFAIGALAIAGLPPLNGFWSEFCIVIAGVMARGWYLLFSIIMIANIVLSVVYYFGLINRLLLDQPSETAAAARPAPVSMVAVMLVMAALCIVIGIYGPYFINLTYQVVAPLT